MDKPKDSYDDLKIADVMQHTLEVFRNEERVNLWLKSDNKSLHNKKPEELLNTITGLNKVNDILGRIEEGVYS